MPGLSNSNYAGVHGVLVNPSQVTDTRYGFFLNLGGVNFTANKDYFNQLFDNSFFTYPMFFASREGLYDESLRSGGMDAAGELHINSTLLGPSFMVKLGHNSGMAVFTRFRNLMSGRNIPQAFGPFYTGASQLSSVDPMVAKDLELNANSYSELGVSFGQTLLQRNNHFLKAGITYKKITGIKAAYLSIPELHYHSVQDPASNDLALQLSAPQYQFSLSNTQPIDLKLASLFSAAGNAGSGHGFDFGLTYEFRPKVEQYEYLMDGKIRLDNTRNKYKLRAGFAVLDMGSIRYNGAGGSSMSGEIEGLLLGPAGFMDIGARPGAGLYQTLLGEGDESGEGSFKTRLPARINAQLDYHVAKSFYVNMMLEKSFAQPNHYQMDLPSVLAITPRLEAEGVELAVPLSFVNDSRNLAVGAAVKLGFLELGMSNILAFTGAENAPASNVYIGLRVFSLSKKKKDSDNDGVSDRRDLCPDVQGVWEFRGCPDADLDGVEDKLDECPEVAGPVEFNGCPDTDGDGIRDKSDLCPFERGLVEFYGCPDSDGDGISDYEDDCVNSAGLAAYYGCPDKDNDNIPDSEDSCPEIAGVAEFSGCPDSDGDGVPDGEDDCPAEAGSFRLKGCVDTDGDGVADYKDQCPDEKGSDMAGGCPDLDMDNVPDKMDQCPEIAGEAYNGGCPVFQSGYEEVILAKNERELLRQAEGLLAFDAELELLPEAKESLLSLIGLMQSNENYRILIMYFSEFGGEAEVSDDPWGQASQSWSSSENKEDVAEAKANAIKQFLIDQNVFSDQVKVEQKWLEDVPETVEMNQEMIMLRLIK